MGVPPTTSVTELHTERLVCRRSDVVEMEAVLEFFVRNVDHFDPWLPEAVPIAMDPCVGEMLEARGAVELAAGREERWFLFDRETDEVVGYVFLTRFRRDGHSSCEISYGLGERHLGRGLMTEAVRRMLQHVEEDLGFSRVDARYAVENARSGAVLERLGFEKIGVAPAHARIGGTWMDHVLVTRVRRGSAIG